MRVPWGGPVAGDNETRADDLAGPKDDSAAIALLKGADFSGYQSSEDEGSDEIPADLLTNDDTEANVGVEGEDEPADLNTEQPEPESTTADTQPDWAAPVKALSDKLDALLAKLNGGTGDDTSGGEQPGDNAQASSGPSTNIQQVKERIKAAREKLGDETVDDLGLDDIVALIEEKTKPLDDAKALMAKQQAESQQQAQAQIHRFFDTASKADAALAKVIGASGKTASAKQQENRAAIFDTAVELQQQSRRAARMGTGKVMSDEVALAKAIETITGRQVDITARSEGRDARDRARAARPGTGGVSAGSRTNDPNRAGISVAVANIRQFLQSQQRAESAA